ncbi:25415_t:CDS:2 [Gigaspora rosea]|nr:25415_t:CDS:2 [Gigaspora rosea]
MRFRTCNGAGGSFGGLFLVDFFDYLGGSSWTLLILLENQKSPQRTTSDS